MNQFLDWGWPPFLTEEFDDLLPILDVSLVAGAFLNLVWIATDPPWVRHTGQIGLNVISLIVTVRTWQIFPFDFSDYTSVWETVARVALVVGIVGLVIATISEVAALFGADGGEEPAEDTAAGNS